MVPIHIFWITLGCMLGACIMSWKVATMAKSFVDWAYRADLQLYSTYKGRKVDLCLTYLAPSHNGGYGPGQLVSSYFSVTMSEEDLEQYTCSHNASLSTVRQKVIEALDAADVAQRLDGSVLGQVTMRHNVIVGVEKLVCEPSLNPPHVLVVLDEKLYVLVTVCKRTYL